MAMRSTAPSTPPTSSAPLPRIETVWPSMVEVGITTSVARCTSSLTSSGAMPCAESGVTEETGTAPAELGAVVITGARFGANDPACRLKSRRVCRLVQILVIRLRRNQIIHHLALELALNLPMRVVTGKC